MSMPIRVSVLILLELLLSAKGLADVTGWEDLGFENLRGEQESLQHYRGRVVVLNFWATWCGPCREEMPLFVRLRAEYESRGVEFIGASRDVPEDLEKVRDFVAAHGIEFPIWVNTTEEQQATFRLATALPATAILDTEGQLQFRIIGQVDNDALTARLDWLLSGQTTGAPADLLLPDGMSPEHFEKHMSGEDEHHHEEATPVEASSEVPS